MKKIIAELDKIAGFIEDVNAPWAYEIMWRLDRVAQELQEKNSNTNDFSKIKASVMAQYKDRILFLDENEGNLINLVKQNSLKKAVEIYKKNKIHFGKLTRDDSINFIRKVLKSIK